MDGRKNNGGNSTKAKGVDKRMNQYKDVVNNALTHEDLTEVFKMLYEKATVKGDVKAAQILIEYTVGKPVQQTDVTSGGRSIGFSIKDIVDFKS